MIKVSTKVKMSESLKVKFIGPCGIEHQKWDEEGEFCLACSREHIEEFGDCVGIVDSVLDYNGEVCDGWWNVRWEPSNLCYAYEETDLELIETNDSQESE